MIPCLTWLDGWWLLTYVHNDPHTAELHSVHTITTLYTKRFIREAESDKSLNSHTEYSGS